MTTILADAQRRSSPVRKNLNWPRSMVIRALTVAGLGMFVASVAIAAQSGGDAIQSRSFPVAQIFTFLFLMLGPFKIIAPFARMTKKADGATTRKIAVLSILFSSAALLLAGFFGERILNSYGIPLPVLALAAGIILFLVALQGVLEQFTPHAEDPEVAEAAPTISMALNPLAFPIIVTPYGIAAVVVFLAFSPDLQSRLLIGAIVLAIMSLNLIVMIASRRILPVLGVLLPILGAILGVVQVALGLQIINNSLRSLGVL